MKLESQKQTSLRIPVLKKHAEKKANARAKTAAKEKKKVTLFGSETLCISRKRSRFTSTP